jgi:hypothetical protein
MGTPRKLRELGHASALLRGATPSKILVGDVKVFGKRCKSIRVLRRGKASKPAAKRNDHAYTT